jgi:hypothetical protein
MSTPTAAADLTARPPLSANAVSELPAPTCASPREELIGTPAAAAASANSWVLANTMPLMSPPVKLAVPGAKRSTSPCAPPEAAAQAPTPFSVVTFFDGSWAIHSFPPSGPHRLGARAAAAERQRRLLRGIGIGRSGEAAVGTDGLVQTRRLNGVVDCGAAARASTSRDRRESRFALVTLVPGAGRTAARLHVGPSTSCAVGAFGA